MSADLGRIAAFASDGRLNVVIETPKTSRGKFKYDPASGAIELHKLLPPGFAFPYDFGFVPSTTGDDGDPLDALVLLEVPVTPGTVVRCRLLGVIEAEQTERDGRVVRNDRLIARPDIIGATSEVDDLAALPDRLLSGIEAFFVDYDRREGKSFRVLARKGAEAAKALVSASIQRGG